MTADIGTRRGAKISDVLENSTWINGQRNGPNMIGISSRFNL